MQEDEMTMEGDATENKWHNPSIVVLGQDDIKSGITFVVEESMSHSNGYS